MTLKGAAAVAAELRAIPWSALLGPAALGALLLAVTTAGVMGGPSAELWWLALGSIAAGLAACLDEPAAAVTAACPVPRRRRTGARMLVVLVVLAAWALSAWAVDGVHQLSGPSLAVTGIGLLLGTVAAADVTRRAGRWEPGTALAPAVLLLVVSGLLFHPGWGDTLLLQAQRVPDSSPWPLPWLVVTLVAIATLWLTSADPLARRPSR